MGKDIRGVRMNNEFHKLELRIQELQQEIFFLQDQLEEIKKLLTTRINNRTDNEVN